MLRSRYRKVWNGRSLTFYLRLRNPVSYNAWEEYITDFIETDLQQLKSCMPVLLNVRLNNVTYTGSNTWKHVIDALQVTVNLVPFIQSKGNCKWCNVKPERTLKLPWNHMQIRKYQYAVVTLLLGGGLLGVDERSCRIGMAASTSFCFGFFWCFVVAGINKIVIKIGLPKPPSPAQSSSTCGGVVPSSNSNKSSPPYNCVWIGDAGHILAWKC